MSEKKRRALIVVGHGSHFSGKSAAPVWAHVQALRERRLFDEVVPAFWKEEPSLREVIRTVNAHEVVIVPLFISEGYFTERILPRELGLAQATANTVSWIDGKRVIYGAPVGTHPAMTSVLLARARQIGQREVLPEECALVIVGHGTPRHAKSSQSIYHQVAKLRAKGEYAEVIALFMDEAPYVSEILERCEAQHIIVVPYFIADGRHTQKDIPAKLGLAPLAAISKSGERQPVVLGKGAKTRRLWYMGAVGTDSAVVEVILSRAEEALTSAPQVNWAFREPVAARAHRAFAKWVRQKATNEPIGVLFGQLMIQPTAKKGWILCHMDDINQKRLKKSPSAYISEQLSRYDEQQCFRPSKAAPTLQRGWRLELANDDQLCHTVDAFYPAAVVAWYDEKMSQLNPTPFFETAVRQSGRYRMVRQINSKQARCAIRAQCAGCLKRITWNLSTSEALGLPRGNGQIPCREACGLLIDKARQVIVGDYA